MDGQENIPGGGSSRCKGPKEGMCSTVGAAEESMSESRWVGRARGVLEDFDFHSECCEEPLEVSRRGLWF